MDIDILTGGDHRIKNLFAQIEQMKTQIESIQKNSHPLFNGERYLTDVDLSAKLMVSRRTTQEWRSIGVLGYTLLGGKSLYRESDIEKLLKDNYYPPF